MRETYQPPTTSPPALRMTTLPRHSREGGNPPPRCVQLPKRRPPPTVDRNRHNPTESNEPQRKLVRAREATAFRFLSPNMDRIRRIPWSCRLISLMPINQTEQRRPRSRPLYLRRDRGYPIA